MLLIDKPIGISSFGIVAAVRRATGVTKVGHAGTLDPLATGLMLVLVGKGETRQAQALLGLDKSYEAIVRIGEERDTGDLEGKIVICERGIGVITRETVKKQLKTMVGSLRLAVPAYSAIKRNGKRLYKQARREAVKGHLLSETLVLPIRDMLVHEVKLMSFKEVILWDSRESCRRGYEVGIMFTVASGVYIRSLAEEFGKRLGYPATLAGLRRISIDTYDIKDAQTLGEISSGTELKSVDIELNT